MTRILSILVVFAALLFVVPRAFAAPAGDERGDDSATVWTLYEGSITVEMGDLSGFDLKAEDSDLASAISGEVDRDLH